VKKEWRKIIYIPDMILWPPPKCEKLHPPARKMSWKIASGEHGRLEMKLHFVDFIEFLFILCIFHSWDKYKIIFFDVWRVKENYLHTRYVSLASSKVWKISPSCSKNVVKNCVWRTRSILKEIAHPWFYRIFISFTYMKSSFPWYLLALYVVYFMFIGYN
jgi:hypothetical protein